MFLHATCSAHLICFDLIVLIMFNGEWVYKVRSSFLLQGIGWCVCVCICVERVYCVMYKNSYCDKILHDVSNFLTTSNQNYH